MSRTKGSKNKTPEERKKKEKYKFKVGDIIIYLGGLYKDYKHMPAIIISRHIEKRHYNYYLVKFNDGRKMNLREDWICDKIEKGDNIEL